MYQEMPTHTIHTILFNENCIITWDPLDILNLNISFDINFDY